MKEGRRDLECGRRRKGAQVFRDGLMVAALASRPLRRRNFAALEIGKTFSQGPKRFHVRFEGNDTKKGNIIEFDYPPFLTSPFSFYLAKARPILRARSKTPDDGLLWVSRRGRAMDAMQITLRISAVTNHHLGRMISPHLFRDCVATDVAIHDPKHIGIVKVALGHATLASSQRHYNQATSFQAASRHAAAISLLRGDTSTAGSK